MAKRQPRPFFRNQTQTWYLQIGKQQINLGPAKDDAWEQYYQIMANIGQMQSGPLLTVSRLIDHFLTWCEQNRASRTRALSSSLARPVSIGGISGFAVRNVEIALDGSVDHLAL